jgi:hypothetical protein
VSRRLWSPGEVEALRAAYETDGPVDLMPVARALGRPAKSLREKACRIGLRRRSRKLCARMVEASQARLYGARVERFAVVLATEPRTVDALADLAREQPAFVRGALLRLERAGRAERLERLDRPDLWRLPAKPKVAP